MQQASVYTEVSLRRNYQDLRFCPQNSQQDLQESRRRSLAALETGFPGGKVLDTGAMIRQGLPHVQEALLPRDYHRVASAALFDAGEGLSAAINMDEHLVIKAAGELEDLDKLVSQVRQAEQSLVQEGLEFARDEDFGYLSFRPALSGSGFYISAVLHLPMLHFLKQFRSLKDTLDERGFSLKPLAMKDGRNPGKLFVLSNNGSHRREDRQTVADVLELAGMLAKKEADLQQKAMAGNGNSTFADQAWRSYGILRYARRLSASDFMANWSNLRLGSLAGFLPLELGRINQMLAYANDHAFLSEGDDPKLFVARRAQSVRQALSGG